jgi:hypothetical protein
MKLTMEDLSTKTVMELKSYAKKNNIDLFGVKTKLEILEVIASFHPNESKPEKAKKEEEKQEDTIDKVALYSARNIHWNGLGSLSIGYNIVSKEASEKMVAHKAVRIASPQEVASYYGK